MNVVTLTLDVHRALVDGDIPHAFGGALAFGYYAETRATVDADVSVFVAPAEIPPVIDLLAPLGLEPVTDAGGTVPVAGIELRRPATRDRCDLFPALDERYAEIEARCVIHPFGPHDEPLPFLAVEDVVLFKLSFGRDKDWVDLKSLVLYHPDLDVETITDLLVHLRGPSMHPRIARLRALLREAHGGDPG